MSYYTEKDTKEISEYAAKAAREEVEYQKNKELKQKDAEIEKLNAEIRDLKEQLLKSKSEDN